MSAAVSDRRSGEFVHDLGGMLPADPHSAQVKAAFNQFPAAVGAVCALVDGERTGLIASSIAVGVSYDPPMVLFSVRKDSQTWPVLRRAPHIGISILSEHQSAVCQQLSARGQDRFRGLVTESGEAGAVFVQEAISWLDCSIAAVTEAGDHEVVVFRVHAVSVAESANPLIYHQTRFRLLQATCDG
ncbi:flavin reductase family protein [Dactylosporangium sp. NPDC051484]|uniref:flavin reductase family protein n=1 Tax=Dactylosporangium sp. NPDC051484 TaxID=3154942 RepID=UPI0034500022